mgnify:CR=1 FL=1|tara:strand:- start:1211 stop:2173 length:963 start_codon:yes stop_codon:yes gene_type:complete
MKKIALILGGLGQDGIEMSIFLKKKEYKIISLINKKNSNLKKINYKKIKYFFCKVEDTKKIILIIKKFKPLEIYNFSGISTIAETEKNILLNEKVNSTSFLKLLNALKKIKYKGKIFQSLSAEVYGDYNYQKININSEFNPSNPYAIAKLTSYYYARYFRNRFQLKIYCAFLYNHDSKYNKKKHLLHYIVNNFKKISSSKINNFVIKNITSKRDWNLATDFVHKIWNVVQTKKPCDFILRSGSYNTVEEIIFNTARFFKIPIVKLQNGNKVTFINAKTNKPIIYSSKYKEKLLIYKKKIIDIKLIKKNKLLKIINNISNS